MAIPRFVKTLNSKLTGTSMEVRSYLFRDTTLKMTINPHLIGQHLFEPLKPSKPGYQSHSKNPFIFRNPEYKDEEQHKKRQSSDKEDKWEKAESSQSKSPLVDLHNLAVDEETRFKLDRLINSLSFALNKKIPSNILPKESLAKLTGALKKLDLEEILEKTLDITLPMQKEKLTDVQLDLRKRIASAGAETLKKNPKSTYIYLVAFINQHLMNNNYPVPPEIGNQILENLNHAADDLRGSTYLHFNETLIFGRNAVSKAMNEGTIDYPSVLGSVLNVVGGMLTGPIERNAQKLSFTQTHTGITKAQEKSLKTIGKAFMEIGGELKSQAAPVDKIKLSEAFKAYTEVSEVLKPKSPSPTKTQRR